MKSLTLKSLKINKRTSSITWEHTDSEVSQQPCNDMTALAVLLGGYNTFGRKIDIDKHNSRLEKLNELIEETKNDLY